MRFWGWIAAIFIGIPVVLGLTHKEKPKDPNAEAIVNARYGAETHVERQLRDPSSAEYSEVAVYALPNGGFVTCGYVNAKNAFGGMTGRKPFFASATDAIIGEGETLSVVLAAWSQSCVTKTEYQP